MPTHPLIPFMESPDGLGQDFLSSSSASMPGASSSMTPHASFAQKIDVQVASTSLPVDCMFCEQSFEQQEELGPHVLSEHPTTLFGPAVLRVEAEFRAPGERLRPKPQNACGPVSPEGALLSCVVCGQEVVDSAELEIHMKSHKDCYCYCCSICGRRFKEPWFLKNHMRTHGGKARGRTLQDPEDPVTINGVVQDQPPPTVVSSYRMCMICGFFFPDVTALTEHSRVHCRKSESCEEEEEGPCEKGSEHAEETPTCQDAFLRMFQLQSAAQTLEQQGPSRGIALNPFNTYQAWQLATKGKITTGVNVAKELSPDSISDNEDSCSDKEELGRIWGSAQGAREERAGKEGLRRQLKPSGAETPSPEPEQKNLRKDKPTHCQECGKTFRTYHQLVLHSRVHKRERVGAESPTTSLDGKAYSTGSADSAVLDRAEEYTEEGCEEASPARSDKNEEKMKLKILAPSRTCTYCGKTFRSSYYLNIHLRTHTGEKPYKCEYCDYAAAQKTSLRYHLDRRHRDKPYTEIPNIPVSSTTSTPSAKEKEPSHNVSHKSLFPSVPGTTDTRPEASDGLSQQGTVASSSPLPLVKTEPAVRESQHAAALKPEANDEPNLKAEGSEGWESPLDLSLRVSVSVASASDLCSQLPTSACPSCPFTTLYPEVLVMHQKLVHKEKLGQGKRPAGRGTPKLRRHTGCPPALEGRDVSPLVTTDRKHPRRTTSPPPAPTAIPKAAEKSQPFPNQAPQSLPKCSPVRKPEQDRQGTRLIVPNPTHGSSKLALRPVETPAKFGNNHGTMLPDRDRGASQRSGSAAAPAQGSVVWPSDAVRLCLSSRFARLPHRDYAEPVTKRSRHCDSALDRPGVRRPLEEHPHLLPPDLPGAGARPHGNVASASGQESKMAPSAGTATGESDWSVINLLRSYTPSDLPSLYRSSPSHASPHGTVNRPLLYPPYSLLQRTEPPRAVSQEPKRCQPSEKSS